jgi:hypothetical protein
MSWTFLGSTALGAALLIGYVLLAPRTTPDKPPVAPELPHAGVPGAAGTNSGALLPRDGPNSRPAMASSIPAGDHASPPDGEFARPPAATDAKCDDSAAPSAGDFAERRRPAAASRAIGPAVIPAVGRSMGANPDRTSADSGQSRWPAPDEAAYTEALNLMSAYLIEHHAGPLPPLSGLRSAGPVIRATLGRSGTDIQYSIDTETNRVWASESPVPGR